MAYEIPQQLEHKEKIMWGLTFGQLGWAFLFGSIALIILLRKGSLYMNASLSAIPIIIGILFIFFDVFSWIKYLIHFLRTKDMPVQSNLIPKFHGVKSIKDDVLESDSNLAVIEIFPLNFKIKTETEKESITLGFQKFLNSFDFPIQIVMTTQKLSIDNYLTSMSTKVKDTSLFDSFKLFIDAYIKDHEMRNRRFFIIIPSKSDLNIQCQVVCDRLSSIGLVNRRLKDNQIIEILRVFFNSKSTVPEASEYVQKVIGLESVKSHFDYLEVNGKFCRVITAQGYPRSVDSGFLDKIISADGDFDISIHIEPFNINTMLVMLNSELQKQRADLYSEQLKGSITPSLEIKYSDTKRILEELQKGEEKLFQVSLYINCKADSLEKLELLTKKVESELNSVMIIPEIPKLRQLDAYRSMIPTGRNILQARRNVGTKALSAFFPFSSPFLPLEQTGVMLGLNRNNVPLIRDIFALSNPNGLVLATSGAGKSYFTKLLLLRQLMNGTRVIVIDPQSEYVELAKAYNGQVVTISKDSPTIINPLDPMGHDILEKRLSLMDLFKIMFGDLSETQKSILDRAIMATYIKAENAKFKRIPILQDLYATLEEQSKGAKNMDQVTFGALLNRLHMYTSGVFGFLNRQTSINFNSNFICFNIGSMPKQVKAVVMFLILDYVYMKMKATKEPKLLVIDEAWSLLSQAEEASYLFEIVKTCRKYNMGLLLITQDVADLVNSKAGHAVLANSAYTLLLRQKPAIIDSVVRTFSLSSHEKEYLLSATKGAGIFIADNDHQEMQVIASPEEHKLITTNPNEEELEKPISAVATTVLDEVYYLAEGLSEYDINTLGNSGYVQKEYTAIGDTLKRPYFVRRDTVGGEDHAFYVENIVKYLMTKTKSTVSRTTVEPDVIFETKRKKKYFIEVETGIDFKWEKKKKTAKFKKLETEHKNDLVILLLDSQIIRSFRRITRFPVVTREELPEFLAYWLAPHSNLSRGSPKRHDERKLIKRRNTRKIQ